jgi:hypothetical protein
MALAKALKSSRSEAEQRVRIEQELNTVRAKLQRMILQQADFSFNSRLFSEMNHEATANLDEIARLSGILMGRNPVDLAIERNDDKVSDDT